jgi:hypothetical protein
MKQFNIVFIKQMTKHKYQMTLAKTCNYIDYPLPIARIKRIPDNNMQLYIIIYILI